MPSFRKWSSKGAIERNTNDRETSSNQRRSELGSVAEAWTTTLFPPPFINLEDSPLSGINKMEHSTYYTRMHCQTFSFL